MAVQGGSAVLEANLNLTSASIQAATAILFAVTFIGVARVLPRPAIRSARFAACCIALSGVGILLATWARSSGAPVPVILAAFLAAHMLTPWFAAAAVWEALLDIAGASTRGAPPVRTLVIVGVAALVTDLTASIGARALAPATQPAITIWASFSAICVYAFVMLRTWRTMADVREKRGAALLLITALAMQSGRALVTLSMAALALTTTGGGSGDGVATVAAQVVLELGAGVALLLAVLEDERSAIITQAERLARAEATLAASQRLESLGRMASGVAHDFNNILTVIAGGAALSRQESLTVVERDAELLEIQAAAGRGQELTRQLLAFARKRPIVATRIDVDAQIGSLGGMLRRVAGPKIAVSIVPSPVPLKVELDPSTFDQVLVNLVANARDAMPDGGKVVIETSALADGRHGAAPGERVQHGWARIVVADNGAGIPKDVLPHVFEPFFTTKDESHGTGLGLATCHGIIEQAGGTIRVTSVPGQGTRFEIELPLVAI